MNRAEYWARKRIKVVERYITGKPSQCILITFDKSFHDEMAKQMREKIAGVDVDVVSLQAFSESTKKYDVVHCVGTIYLLHRNRTWIEKINNSLFEDGIAIITGDTGDRANFCLTQERAKKTYQDYEDIDFRFQTLGTVNTIMVKEQNMVIAQNNISRDKTKYTRIYKKPTTIDLELINVPL